MTPLELMSVGPVIPVIVIENLAKAVPLAKALVAGGVRVLEVTLRTPVALDAIRAIASALQHYSGLIQYQFIGPPHCFNSQISG